MIRPIFSRLLTAEAAAILAHLDMDPSNQVVLVNATLPSARVEFLCTRLRAIAEVVSMNIHDELPTKFATAFVTVRGGEVKEAALHAVPQEVLISMRSALLLHIELWSMLCLDVAYSR